MGTDYSAKDRSKLDKNIDRDANGAPVYFFSGGVRYVEVNGKMVEDGDEFIFDGQHP